LLNKQGSEHDAFARKHCLDITRERQEEELNE